MKEQKPLCIEYLVETDKVYFGWSVNREKINLYGMNSAILERKDTLVSEWQGEGALEEKIHKGVLEFFNGPISSDLNIPNGYPYELYEHGKEKLIFSGKLREETE
ncbi:MAG: hypothetical protein PHH54_06460 [Candidatus Nanoarchaeia archaeon]|nr:hypothetical protein [Candidatus Nanoarchaeia archaeon]MDD5741598.1 hypothetical protein [Candidatus Nanoarchaeia archaeon]